MSRPALTLLLTYVVKGPAGPFHDRIARLARRAEAEGEAGLVSYRYFINETDGTVRAVLDYADAAAWIAHHDTTMSWPELAALHEVAELTEVIFLGPLTPELLEWIETSTFASRIRHGFREAAGFQRPRQG